MSHTYAIVPVSQATFDEIKAKLLGAGYEDQLHEDPEGLILDMHGLALQVEEPTPKRDDGCRCAETAWTETPCPVHGFKGPA